MVAGAPEVGVEIVRLLRVAGEFAWSALLSTKQPAENGALVAPLAGDGDAVGSRSALGLGKRSAAGRQRSRSEIADRDGNLGFGHQYRRGEGRASLL